MFFKLKNTSTTPSCRGPIPAQKSQDNSVLGVVFPHMMPEMDFHYSHRLGEKKFTNLIYHMPWLYQYSPIPFHRSYKNGWTILKKIQTIFIRPMKGEW